MTLHRLTGGSQEEVLAKVLRKYLHETSSELLKPIVTAGPIRL